MDTLETYMSIRDIYEQLKRINTLKKFINMRDI